MSDSVGNSPSGKPTLDELREQIAQIQHGQPAVSSAASSAAQADSAACSTPVASADAAGEQVDKTTKKLRARLERRALYMLSSREYSRQELAQKLLDRPLYKANSAKAQFKRYAEAQNAERAAKLAAEQADYEPEADESDDIIDMIGPLTDDDSVGDLPVEPPNELVAEWVEQLLNQLENDGYLSDERYCEAYVRSKANAGKGPVHIMQHLRKNGVASHLINDQMALYDWYEQAREVREHKFGTAVPDDYKQRAKQMRFLQSRGFGSDECRAAVT